MKKTKRLLTAASLLAVAAVLLSGCVHMTAKIRINSDGSADYGMDLLMADSLTSLAGADGTDIWGDTTKQMQGQGYDVKNIKDGDYSGISATKHYKSVADIQSGDIMTTGTGSDLPSAQSSFSVKEKKGLFATTYDVSMKFDMSDAMKQATSSLGDLSGLGGDASTGTDDSSTDTSTDGTTDTSGLDPDAIANMMLSQMKMSFVVTLPVKAVSSNATSVSADGLTYTWDLKLDQPNDIQLSAALPNPTNILLVAGGAGLVVLVAAALVIVLVVLKKNRKKKLAAQSAAAAPSEVSAAAEDIVAQEASSEALPPPQPPVEM